MTNYPPVGYIIVKLLEPDYDIHENVSFFHNYEDAKSYCDFKNKNRTDRWYYEPNEVDILD